MLRFCCKSLDPFPQGNVVNLSKGIEQRKKSFEGGGWNVPFSRGTGKKPKVVNVPQIVFRIMEAALFISWDLENHLGVNFSFIW